MFWQTQTVCGISYTLLKIIIIVHRQNVHTWTSQFVPLQNVYMTSNYFPYDMYRVTCILDFIHTRQARRQEFPEGVTLRVTHLAESKFWTLNKTSFLIVLICFKGGGGFARTPRSLFLTTGMHMCLLIVLEFLHYSCVSFGHKQVVSGAHT